MTQEYIGTKIITAWEQEKDGRPGYAVKYADGYTSWSPKDTFENAYIPLGHVAHKPAYQRRVIGEHAELQDKVHKLEKFKEAEFFATLPELERWRLSEQLTHMRNYLAVLQERIENFPAA